MKVLRLLEHLEEARSVAALSNDGKVVVLVRNLEHELTSDDAWSVAPVIGFEIDEDDLDLQIDLTGSNSSLSLGEFETKLRALLPDGAGFEIFVKGEFRDIPSHDGWQTRRDVPVVGSVINEDERLFGMMMWYEGCDTELED